MAACSSCRRACRSRQWRWWWWWRRKREASIQGPCQRPAPGCLLGSRAAATSWNSFSFSLCIRCCTCTATDLVSSGMQVLMSTPQALQTSMLSFAAALRQVWIHETRTSNETMTRGCNSQVYQQERCIGILLGFNCCAKQRASLFSSSPANVWTPMTAAASRVMQTGIVCMHRPTRRCGLHLINHFALHSLSILLDLVERRQGVAQLFLHLLSLCLQC